MSELVCMSIRFNFYLFFYNSKLFTRGLQSLSLIIVRKMHKLKMECNTICNEYITSKFAYNFLLLKKNLSQLLIEINCQETPYVLKKRNEHAATLIDNKLYILGGSSINEVGKDFFISIFLVHLIFKI
ncbi:hypothetical protein RhiirC2_224083 [Rhizophagus irregularis]|uniref:Uncharacterized protein n=1 Tax=Rhizophagus irregularis TaxID=588596 RepID=A0A2N1MHU2_9GLOM|nr:hypothetical protein RhiirC2_224083 [Rhizophagus irregularis]